MNETKMFLQNRSMMLTINFIIIFTVLLISLSAWPGWGATYFVKTGGNDKLDGLSDATAWATISKVKAMATSGDTVYFRSQDTWTSSSLPVLLATDGVTYDGSTYGSGTRAKMLAGATQTYNTVSTVEIFASNVIFRGFDVDSHTLKAGGIYIGYLATSDMSNITIDNCVVHNVGEDAGSWIYGIYIGTVNNPGVTLSNVTVSNTTVYNVAHEGIAIYPTWQYGDINHHNINNAISIKNCTIYNAGIFDTPTTNTFGYGITVVNDSRNVTIEYCNIFNNSASGIWVRTAATYEGNDVGAPTNLTVRYNNIHNNWIHGIGLLDIRGETITGSFYGNIIYNNGKTWKYNYASDISIGGGEYAQSVLNFYNNTIYSTTNQCSPAYGVAVAQFSSKITGTAVFNFRNNIVYTGNYTPIYDHYNWLKHSNNLVYRSSGASDTHVNSNGTSYNRTGIKTWEASVKNSDPGFVGGTLPTGFNLLPNSNYFAINSGDALDNGATLGSPYNGCINGAGLAVPVTRPQGPAYDIGAYEYITPPAASINLMVD
jgi:hypothetical protein